MNQKKIIRITLLTLFISIALAILPYLFNFRSASISDKSEIWGTFGDYFGGILNPVLGIINIVILVYITFQIHDLEDKRARNDLVLQKKIAQYGLKHDALKELNKMLRQVHIEFVTSKADSTLNIVLIQNEFRAFIETHTYLFQFFNEETWRELDTSIGEVSDLSDLYYKSGKSLNVETEIKPILQKFLGLKSDFILKIQNEILD